MKIYVNVILDGVHFGKTIVEISPYSIIPLRTRVFCIHFVKSSAAIAGFYLGVARITTYTIN